MSGGRTVLTGSLRSGPIFSRLSQLCVGLHVRAITLGYRVVIVWILAEGVSSASLTR
jgi:hypothetical protein